MPHSGFGATLKPDPLRKFDPTQDFFLQTLQFFLLNVPSAVVYNALRNFLYSLLAYNEYSPHRKP